MSRDAALHRIVRHWRKRIDPRRLRDSIVARPAAGPPTDRNSLSFAVLSLVVMARARRLFEAGGEGTVLVHTRRRSADGTASGRCELNVTLSPRLTRPRIHRVQRGDRNPQLADALLIEIDGPSSQLGKPSSIDWTATPTSPSKAS